PAFTGHDRINPIRRHPQRQRKLIHAEPQRFQELFTQNFTGMNSVHLLFLHTADSPSLSLTDRERPTRSTRRVRVRIPRRLRDSLIPEELKRCARAYLFHARARDEESFELQIRPLGQLNPVYWFARSSGAVNMATICE